ncbi:centrosomal protein of 78 kDa [Menidia menidia]
MVHENAPTRRKDAHEFEPQYDLACARQDSVPLPAVKVNLDKGMLDFNGDRLKLIDWPPILLCISINKNLRHIAISSTYQATAASGDTDRRYYRSNLRRKIPTIRSKEMTLKLCKALRECLTGSPSLKSLHLNGLPLRERDLITLTKGLVKSTSLESLSLANCPISDEGLEVICQSTKYSTTIKAVDFTGCSITWRGAEHIARIIKYQGMQRHGTAWAESLRYRHPQFEGMSGLRRVTLNCNTLIGDRGAAALAHELADDLWVKAVDLQRCGLSSDGARRLLESLKTNSSLCVLDIRSNPLVDNILIKTVIEKVLMNARGQSPEYCWIKPATTESPRASLPKRRLPSALRGKPAFKIAAHKATCGGRGSGVAQTKKSSSRYVPWRAAARAGRQRGLPPGVTVTNQRFQGAATVKVIMESESDNDDADDDDYDNEEEEKEGKVLLEMGQRPSSLHLQDTITSQQLHRVQMELKECRLSLAVERRARLKAESRLMEYELENARLRDANHSLTETLAATGPASAPLGVSALEDEEVLESIEKSFNKFHSFLDLLKDAGLGQLASVAGIDQSDFQPLGRPQLSSTIGPHLDAAASRTTEEFRDMLAKTDALSVAGDLRPDMCKGDTNIITHRPPTPVSAPLSKETFLNETIGQTVGHRENPAEAAEEEEHLYFRPDVQPDTGSERSFQSQKSFDHLSFGKPFQKQSQRQRSEASSHRSNISRGYSFNNSRAYSQASQSNGCHKGSSESVSEIISDRAESVGSVGSRNSRKERLVTVGQSGSEGSERAAYPGRGAFEHIRTLGGQSDDSF